MPLTRVHDVQVSREWESKGKTGSGMEATRSKLDEGWPPMLERFSSVGFLASGLTRPPAPLGRVARVAAYRQEKLQFNFAQRPKMRLLTLKLPALCELICRRATSGMGTRRYTSPR